LAANFDVRNVNPNPARFDQKKADAINASHIRLLGAEDFRGRLIPYLQAAGILGSTVTLEQDAILAAAAPLVQERMTVLSEAVGMLGFLFTASDHLVYEEDALAGLPENTREIVEAAVSALAGLSAENFKTEQIQAELNRVLIEEMQLKPRLAFGPIRTAISGRRVSPPLFESMEILGADESLQRLKRFAERF
jgi:glutamyl-tRNA synthetase